MKSIPLFLKIVCLILVWILIIVCLAPKEKHYDDLNYEEFYAYLGDERVESVIYFPTAKYALIQVKPYRTAYRLIVISGSNFEDAIFQYYSSHPDLSYMLGVEQEQASIYDIIILGICSSMLVLAAFRLIEWYLSINATAKFYGRGKNRYKTNVKFSDVIGLEKQLDDIKDIVRFLKEPQKYEEIGATLPKGILLYGPPGVGKTHIARAIAGEADVPFFEISAPELESKWVGEGEERIRKLFKTAKKKAPSVIYIDELDSIAMERFSEDSNTNMVGLINQLLACMDGFSKEDNVVVIASTNHIDSLDRAILRNGRFDRKILIHAPDKEARKKMIDYYAKGKKFDSMVSVTKLLNISAGLTGADIKTILNEAALLSVREGKDAISEEVLMEAFRKAAIGSEHTNSPIPKEKLKQIAIHESGHAIVSHYFLKGVSEISIVARGRAAGYNLRSEEESINYTYGELKEELWILLGGRAAEEVVYYEDNLSVGASDDLRRATNLVKDMFLRYAFPLGGEESLLVISESESLNQEIIGNKYSKMNQYLGKEYRGVLQFLESRKELLFSLSDILLEKETISEEEVKNFFQEKENN